MSKFQIDKAIPVPGLNKKYPWDKMAVGDSFFVPGRGSGGISSAVNSIRNRSSAKFTCRTVTEDGVKGVRIWRIE